MSACYRHARQTNFTQSKYLSWVFYFRAFCGKSHGPGLFRLGSDRQFHRREEKFRHHCMTQHSFQATHPLQQRESPKSLHKHRKTQALKTVLYIICHSAVSVRGSIPLLYNIKKGFLYVSDRKDFTATLQMYFTLHSARENKKNTDANVGQW